MAPPVANFMFWGSLSNAQTSVGGASQRLTPLRSLTELQRRRSPKIATENVMFFYGNPTNLAMELALATVTAAADTQSLRRTPQHYERSEAKITWYVFAV
jgi:hypothetical protein